MNNKKSEYTTSSRSLTKMAVERTTRSSTLYLHLQCSGPTQQEPALKNSFKLNWMAWPTGQDWGL